MRNDLTAAFLAKMASDSRTPIQVLVVHFELEDVYLSDRDITIGNITYRGIVENWGSLHTVGEETGVSGTMETTITLWNGGDEPFSDWFLTEEPINVFVDVYQTFEGLSDADLAHIGSFVIQDPIELSESSMLLELDLVTTNMRYFGQVGSIITSKAYPYALVKDVNKSLDLIVGDCGNVNTSCIQTPPRATLSGSILKLPTIVNVLEDLDELGFSAFGFIQIDAEIMVYTSRTGSQFVISERGYGDTFTSEHSDGATIIEANKPVIYAVGEGPIGSITDVKVGNQTPTVPYTVHPDENPAVIRFERQPTFFEYSKGARSTDIDFDDLGAGNDSFRGHYAYDTEFRSSGALIGHALVGTPQEVYYPKLVVRQEDLPEDDGEVVRVFLNVEHWSTELRNSDNIIVDVDGIGEVGMLSKPNPDDIVDLEADVDIDHDHDHATGGIHDHGFDNPNLQNVDNQHVHATSISGPEVVDLSSQRNNLPLVKSTFEGIKTVTFSFSSQSNVQKRVLRIAFSANSAGKIRLKWGGTFTTYFEKVWGSDSSGYNGIVNETFNVTGYGPFVLTLWPSGVFGSNVTITECSITTTKVGSIDSSRSNVNASLTTTGDVKNRSTDTTNTPIKDLGDVDDFAGANRQLLNIVTTRSSKIVTDRFDITKHLETVDWNWLNDRNVSVEYTGSIDKSACIVTYAYFEVEYRQRQTSTTDDVTAYVTGSIDSRPDKVMEHLLINKANVPSNMLSSVFRDIPDWEDPDTWDDDETWSDEGEVAGVPPGALFEEAAKWYAFNNYAIDGKIPGDLTVKDALQKITWQTRSKLTWQNGKVKLAILRHTNDWMIAKTLPTSDIRLKSMSAKRSEAANIINNIELFYNLDRLSEASGAEAYDSTAVSTDTTSIAKHGDKKDDEAFQFDLVRSSEMAENIADFYLWQLGETSTYYSFSTYLKHFDVEKLDYVKFNSQGLRNIVDLPGTVAEIERIFGSGKNKTINLLKWICHSIRRYDYKLPMNDTVSVLDSLSIDLTTEVLIDDLVVVDDRLETLLNVGESDTITVFDVFGIVANFNSNLNTDGVYVDDDVVSDMSVPLEDSSTIVSDFEVVMAKCFGACGFGAPDCIGVRFGSKTENTNAPVDIADLTDVLTIGMGVGLTDEAEITDDLIVSDGFGCSTSLGSGFGKVPFGDKNYVNNLLLNNSFRTSLDNWTIAGANPVISWVDGRAFFDDGNGTANNTLKQDFPTEIGKVYRVAFNIDPDSTGTGLRPYVNGAVKGNFYINADTVFFYVKATATTMGASLFRYRLHTGQTYVSSIEALETNLVIENGNFLRDIIWTLGTGWAISPGQLDGSATITSSTGVNSIRQPGGIEGESYDITFEIDSCSAGGFQAYAGGTKGPVVSTPGFHMATVVCGASGEIGVVTSAAGTTGVIRRVSAVKSN